MKGGINGGLKGRIERLKKLKKRSLKAPKASKNLNDWSSDVEGYEEPGDALDTHPPFSMGQLLAPGYEVKEHLHRSNDYDVYDAHSEERACSCIAKVPRPDRLSKLKVRRALLREGNLLCDLKHPHIARAYEVLETPRPTVILETLTGETLAHMIDESPKKLSVEEICFMGIHLCSAMHYLHGQGLLHLDLKPSNVVAERGMAKVLDLSLSRPPGKGKAGVGTDQYMSAEQASGGYLGPAADVWGIGAVLFEAATGEVPFNGHDEHHGHHEQYEQLERSADPVRKHRRVPAAFDTLVGRCLSPEPASRPSVSELAAALEDLV